MNKQMVKTLRFGPFIHIARAIFLLLAASAPARTAVDVAAELASIRDADLRLQTIGERLAVTNAALCADPHATIGVVLIALSAYPVSLRHAVAATLHLDGPLGIEAIVPDGPADKAGLRADDTLIAIAGQTVPTETGISAPSTRELAHLAGMIASLPPGKGTTLAYQRNGHRREAVVEPVATCPVRLELVLSGTRVADSDGVVIRIGAPFMDSLADDQLAAVIAHELAHGVLRHGARLDAAKVHRGLFSLFGRNAEEIRKTEEEADRLSVILLHNAGFPADAAARFWRGYGRTVDGGILRSPTHPSARDRATMLDQAAANLPPGHRFICPEIAPGCK